MPGTVHPLVIIGAGGFARETAEIVAQLNSVESTFDLLGFLDDDDAKKGVSFDGVEVLGRIEDLTGLLAEHADAKVVVCTGSPRDYGSRHRIVSSLALPDERFATVVHPDNRLPAAVDIGCGTVLSSGVTMTAPASIGSHVAVMPQVVLTHDDVIEDFVTIAAGVRLGGGVRVRPGAYLGSGCLIRENVSIGASALVGMGSVVLQDIPSAEVWAGSPARRIRANSG